MMVESAIVYMQCCVCLDLNNLGQLYEEKGMLSEAVNTLEESLAAQQQFLSADHPDIGISL